MHYRSTTESGRHWNPAVMTDQEAVEMRAAADRIVSSWLALETAVVTAYQSQARCQGVTDPLTQRRLIAMRNEVREIVDSLLVTPRPEVPGVAKLEIQTNG